MLSPSTSVWLARMDRVVIASTARPPSISRSTLFTRSRIGFGRRLRGTDQATLVAFWIACPSPRAPYTAASDPSTTAVVEPVRPPGTPSSVLMIGNWESAESSTCCSSSGLPWSTTLRTDVPSSSSGKIAMNA